MSGWSVLRTIFSLYSLPSVTREQRQRAFRATLGLALLLLAGLARPARADALKVEHCDNPTHTLPAGDKDTDLEVTRGIQCIVDGSAGDGTYVYRNVNVWNGTLTFRDAKIDFHAHSILVENGGTLQADSTRLSPGRSRSGSMAVGVMAFPGLPAKAAKPAACRRSYLDIKTPTW